MNDRCPRCRESKELVHLVETIETGLIEAVCHACGLAAMNADPEAKYLRIVVRPESELKRSSH
jgi:hypothetical protein